jgi:type I restriction enzyme S subunit
MVLSNNGYRKALALKAAGSSGSMVNISQEKLKNNNFPLASLKLQSQFEEFVALVDRIKVLLKNSLERNQILFQSFLQKAFKGELDFEKEKIIEDILPNMKLEELLSDLKLLKSLLDKLQKQDFKTGSNYKLAQNLLFQLLDNKKSGVFQQCDVETENIEIKHEAN